MAAKRAFPQLQCSFLGVVTPLVFCVLAGCGAPQVTAVTSLHVDPIAPTAVDMSSLWTGRWQTNWGQLDLQMMDGVVRGAFRYEEAGQERVGLVVGQPRGNQLICKWIEQRASAKGMARLVMAADGSRFSGTYGSGESETDGGEWSGVRVVLAAQ